jgi:TPR repeat protein
LDSQLGAQGKIFISYRREDAPGDARGICDRLGRSFGEASVFMDVDRVLAGQRFDRELDKALSRCDVLIAVIGSRWMELLSEHAGSSKRDFVRDEIAAALKRDIVVIPVMIGQEAHMPSLPQPEDLPEEIRELVLYQKQNIAHESFGRDAAELIAAINAVLRDKRGARPWRAIAVTAAIGLALVVGSLGYWMELIPRIGPVSKNHPQNLETNAATITAVVSPDADRAAKAAEESAKKKAPEDEASRKAAEEARRKAEADAKAADDAARKKAADDEAARKATQQARLAVVTDCDRLAASPYDNDRPKGVAGIADNAKIDVAAAGAACDNAMRGYPEVTRFVYQVGRVAFARKDYTEAMKFFRAAAAKDSVAALNGIGVLYNNGWGVARDYAEARNWYEKAAARGHSAAMNSLGLLYENGRGVAQDYAAARNWYEKGTALGNDFAMYNLGRLYDGGNGATQDYAAARNWYEKSAALGNAAAMRNIGILYANGRGTTQDYAEARNWYEKAAALGDAAAMGNIGNLYYSGRGVTTDYTQARQWYEKAAALGNAMRWQTLA